MQSLLVQRDVSVDIVDPYGLGLLYVSRALTLYSVT